MAIRRSSLPPLRRSACRCIFIARTCILDSFNTLTHQQVVYMSVNTSATDFTSKPWWVIESDKIVAVYIYNMTYRQRKTMGTHVHAPAHASICWAVSGG